MQLTRIAKRYLSKPEGDSPIIRAWPDVYVQRQDEEPYEMPEMDDVVYRLRFTLSSPNPDRDRDVISQDGFDLVQYQRNPVVLWCHRYDHPPIAHAVEIGLNARGWLSAVADFPDRETNPFAHMVYQLYLRGDLSAVSVGFQPIEWTHDEQRGGYNFVKQNLLEFSACPVPMHPEALIDGRAYDDALLRSYAMGLEELIDTGNCGVPVEALARMIKGLTGSSIKVSVSDDIVKRDVPRDVSREKADRDERWVAPKLADFTSEQWSALSDRAKRKIAGHYAYSDGMPPERFSDLSLPHHRASDGAIVYRGVVSAAQRLGQTDIPDDELEAVKAHLGRHYRAFGAVAPWDREQASWEQYRKAYEVLRETDDEEILFEAQQSIERLSKSLFPAEQEIDLTTITMARIDELITKRLGATQAEILAALADDDRIILVD
jgi:HK97 family phage prohead protease